MGARLLEVLKKSFILLTLGWFYLVLYRTGTFQIHCPIRTFTGWLCPGCGISQMFCDLYALDLPSAWRHNPIAFLSFPVLVILGLRIHYRYIKDGSRMVSKRCDAVLWIMVATFLTFGIFRNF
jgi:hypothetical protein